MSQSRGSIDVSFKAGDTISAMRIVRLSAANTVDLAVTATSMGFGITAQYADSGAAIAVTILGSAKVVCGASVSAGAFVTWQTDTGLAVEATHLNNTASSVIPNAIGLALEAGSTNGVIEVLVAPNFINKVAY
jgi:hypothetical protein